MERTKSGRPRRNPGRRPKRRYPESLTVTVTREMFDSLSEAADARGESLAEVVRVCVERALPDVGTGAGE